MMNLSEAIKALEWGKCIRPKHQRNFYLRLTDRLQYVRLDDEWEICGEIDDPNNSWESVQRQRQYKLIKEPLKEKDIFNEFK